MSPREEFDLEHSILEERARHFGALELPLSRKVFLLLAISALAASSIFLFKVFLFFSQKGDFYKARAEANMTQQITLPAGRGNIYDRFGEVLARNESAQRLVLNAGLVKRNKVDIDGLAEELGAILGVSKEDLVATIRQADLEKSALVTLARDISSDQILKIEEMKSGVLEVHDDYRREYPLGPAFSHILGYTGLAKFKDLKGKAGLEKYYDEALSGADGVRLIYRDALGNLLEEKLLEPPRTGNDLYTTIDAELQNYFYKSMKQALANLNRQAGVGLAIDPRSGEILSLVSIPSFDNNIFTDNSRSADRSELLTSGFQPLFNRAVSGAYSPGSTIKPLVAVAALAENVIDPKKQIFSAGFIEIPNPYFPDQPSRFLDWRPQGWVDLRSALARSSNVYFYAVGGGLPGQGYEDVGGLGIAKLKEYWEKFGLGRETGIDMESEVVGFLPDPEQKEARKNDIWRLGDTYNATIGQGDLLVSPVQLISYIASIANGGKLFKPRLVERVENGAGEVLERYLPEINSDLSYLGDYIKEVQSGMEDTVQKSYGTANLLSILPMKVAGKTGSAQISNNTKTNAFFVAYAPAEDPQIAILVLIEDAREGSLNAVPVGKDILEWYYWNRIISGVGL